MQFLFPPLSCLEVIGQPRMEGEVIFFTLRVNMCLKGLTLEQLVARRKNLHLAMFRNIQEEYSVGAPAELAYAGTAASDDCVIQSIQEELKSLDMKYRNIPADSFNIDSEYKALTAEAIEVKSLAFKKIRVFADLSKRGATAAVLDAVRARPIQGFVSSARAIELEIETGLSHFPWSDLVDGKDIVNFGRWSPAEIKPEIYKIAVEELGKNTKVRTVTVLGSSRELRTAVLPDGWQTEQLNLSENKFVIEAPSLLGMLLQNCKCLVQLDLRHVFKSIF